MPITPFHFGPGAALHALAPRHVSFLAFCAANVVIDVESLYNLVNRREPVHAFLHTYIGATLVWLALWAAFWLLRRWAGRWFTWRQVALGALLGAYSHVVLDSVMHRDIRPLMPFNGGNALQGVVDLGMLHLACIASALFALLWMGGRKLLSARSAQEP